jgi:hypothetical protein
LSSDSVTPPQYLLAIIQDPVEKDRVIRTHARWDSTEGKTFLYWIQAASPLEDFDAILAERLKAAPDDVVLRRTEQDTATPAEKPGILQRHRELAKQNPNDPNWQYLGIRAMPDGPEQDQAFLAALEKSPDNPWLNFAAGYLHATHAEWQKALLCFHLPLKRSVPLHDAATIQVARIRRLLAGDVTHDLSDLTDSVELQQHLALESGANYRGTPYFAYSLLNTGQVEEAYRIAGQNTDDPQLLVLIAASKGAPPEAMTRALQWKPDELQNPTALVYLAALAFRNGQPHEAYIERYMALYPSERKTAIDYVKKFIENGSPGELNDADLDGLDPYQRGVTLAAAIVMFPDKAQESWRTAAKALLFAAERPAF